MLAPYEVKLMALTVASSAGVVVTGIVAWTVVKLRQVARGASAGGAALPAATEERLARMEQTLDALTLEMERSAEAQRFTARLLAERVGELPSRVAERVSDRVSDRALGAHRPNNTPH